jgi:hypothetical protein
VEVPTISRILTIEVVIDDITCFIEGAVRNELFSLGSGEFVTIDEIVPCVVGRIDVDHFHFAVIASLEDFQDFQIVTLDKEVLWVIEVDWVFSDGLECIRRCLLDPSETVGLASPRETISLFVCFHQISECRLEFQGIYFAFTEDFREVLPKACEEVGL